MFSIRVYLFKVKSKLQFNLNDSAGIPSERQDHFLSALLHSHLKTILNGSTASCRREELNEMYSWYPIGSGLIYVLKLIHLWLKVSLNIREHLQAHSLSHDSIFFHFLLMVTSEGSEITSGNRCDFTCIEHKSCYRKQVVPGQQEGPGKGVTPITGMFQEVVLRNEMCSRFVRFVTGNDGREQMRTQIIHLLVFILLFVLLPCPQLCASPNSSRDLWPLLCTSTWTSLFTLITVKTRIFFSSPWSQS